MKLRSLIGALAVAWVLQPASARAQAFLADPRLTDGKGVKAGDFELHPGLAGEGGYDSNYFQRAGSNGTVNAGGQTLTWVEDPRISAWRLRLTPSLSFRNYGARAGDDYGSPSPANPSTVRLNGRLAASYNALFLNDAPQAAANQNHVAANAILGADLFPNSTVGADVNAMYTRMVEASNDPDTANAFRRDVIRGSAGLTWRPGGGLFSWRLGYSLTANLFEEDAFQIYNNLQHRAETLVRWRFLPRTVILYRGNITWVEYTNNPATLTSGTTSMSQVGINGLVTSYFGFLALAGWGATFYPNKTNVPAQNFDSFIGQAELTWYPNPQKELPSGTESPLGLSSVSVGYNRNFSISYLSNYYQRDRGYAHMVYFIGEKLVLSLTGGFSHITRPLAFFANGDPQTNSNGPENRVDALAFLEYRFAPSFGIYTSFRYDAELNQKVVATSDTPNATADDLEFSRYQAYLGLRWFL